MQPGPAHGFFRKAMCLNGFVACEKMGRFAGDGLDLDQLIMGEHADIVFMDDAILIPFAEKYIIGAGNFAALKMIQHQGWILIKEPLYQGKGLGFIDGKPGTQAIRRSFNVQ